MSEDKKDVVVPEKFEKLVAEIEKRYPGVRIEDQEITRENFGTIEAILRFVKSKNTV